MSVNELNTNTEGKSVEKIAKNIIRENELNIDWSKDNFFIVDGWNTVKELVSIANGNIHVSNIPYGRVEIEDSGKEYLDIDDILGEWGFADSYILCDSCHGEIHTQTFGANYYWTTKDGMTICGDCVSDNVEGCADEYVAELINNPKKANTILKDVHLEERGFEKCNCKGKECAFEHGWNYGQNANPTEILKNAIEKNPNKEYIFDITGVGQFEIDFTIWSRDKEHECVQDDEEAPSYYQGI